MQLGGLLEELTVARARAGIEKLVHLTPQTARRISGSCTSPASGSSEISEEIIDARSVQVGDILRVLPGETIPVDGTILSGETSVNQAVMTGESLPVDKGPGDAVSSGTVNQFGSFDMRAEKVGEDSSIQRMIRLVQSADAGKAQDRGPCGPVGRLGRHLGSDRRRPHLAYQRGNHPGCHHPGCVLPLLPGSCHPHRHHGRHRQFHPPRLSCPGGGCPGTAG